MPTILPVTDLQRNFKQVLDECQKTGEPIYLTRNGAAAVVVIDAETYDKEMALHREVYDREMRIKKAIERGYEDYEMGRFKSLDDALEIAENAWGKQ